jgi:hypothetical protein
MPTGQQLHPPGTNTAAFHRKQFFAERVGWAAMAAVLTWAIAGGFGDGGISTRRSSDAADSCVVEYQRFGRRDSPLEIHIRIKPTSPNDSLSLHFNREFLDAVRIERVTPDYRAMTAGDDGAEMKFDAQPGAADYSIVLEYKPRYPGSLRGEVRAYAGVSILFEQFIYP